MAKKKKKKAKQPSAKRAKGRVKKKTPTSRARAPKPRPKISAATAEAVPCVPATQAGPLVMRCAGQQFNVQTTLGVAFPDPQRREQFCRCVAQASGVPRQQVPCGAGNTFLDVIVAISC